MLGATRTKLRCALLGGIALGASPVMAADPSPRSPRARRRKRASRPLGVRRVVQRRSHIRLHVQGHHPDGSRSGSAGDLEATYGIFYGGVFVSNVDFRAPEPDVEFDLYGGIRPQLGPVSTDFGYVHYFYPGLRISSTARRTACPRSPRSRC